MSGALRRERLRRRLLRARRPADRRGVLLLVVLSMLVLFLLVGTTFLITSGQYRTQSKVVEKANRSTFQPADLLERALMQLVRDTNNPSSVVRYHSLLRDLYGVDGFVGRVLVDARITGEGEAGLLRTPGGEDFLIAPRYAGVDPTATPAPQNNQLRGVTQGQVIEFFVADIEERSAGSATRLSENNAVGLEFDASGLPVEHQLSEIDGYYNGCLLTFMSGPCRGHSVRVLEYEHIYTKFREQNNQVSDGNLIDDTVTVAARFRVIVPRRSDNRQLSFQTHPNTTNQTAIAELIASDTLGHAFMINGRPFNGSGVGFNPLALSHDLINGVPAPRLSALEFVEMSPGSSTGYGLERALIPNPVQYFEPANVALNPTAGTDPWSKPGTLGGFYLGNEFIPLTSGFVGAGDPAYNAALNSPLYSTFAGSGDTDESYDAPDNQNMALASQALEPRLRGRVAYATGDANNPIGILDPDAYYANLSAPPAYLDLEGVTIPSFHRPALANFWFHRLWNSQWLRGLISDDNERARAILEPYDANGAPQHGLTAPDAAALVGVKRKFLLRPLREDHPEFDGSNPLSRYATGRLRAALNGGALVNPRDPANPNDDEITFPIWEAVGPWDVDNDGDGVPDSVWVDLGLPVQQTEDGRWYKPLVAMLVEDLDGRLNLNAHGSPEHLAENFLDASNVNGDPRNLAQDYALTPSLFSSDQLSEGAGWGVAETSLRPVLSPTLPLDNTLNFNNGGPGAFQGDAQYDDYARLLQGRPDPRRALDTNNLLGAPVQRDVAAPLTGSVLFGRYGAGQLPLETTDQLGNPLAFQLNTPGRTLVTRQTADTEPRFTSTRDPRTPLEFLGYPEFLGLFEQPSGFSSDPDLGGRYTGGQSAAGAPVREPQTDQILSVRDGSVRATLDDSPYELDLSVAARRLAPVSEQAVRLTYDANNDRFADPTLAPLVDDAPFSPAELERLLRAFDADAGKLPDRLWEIVDGFDPDKLAAAQSLANNRSIATLMRNGAGWPISNNSYTPSSLDTVAAAAKAAINRRVVTTESFDLPTPNENWSDRLTLGADGLPGVPRDKVVNGVSVFSDDDGDGLNNEGDEAVVGYNVSQTHTFVGTTTPVDYDALFLAGCDDYVVVMREDPPASPRITDYLRYRVVLELFRTGVYAPSDWLNPARSAEIEHLANEVIGGSNVRPADETTTRGASDSGSGLSALPRPHFSFGGLLAPELLAGVRMNLNRPWGDGLDNNNNGVVDEPQEAGEPFVDANGNGQITDPSIEFLDLDGDGVWYGDLDRDGVIYVDNNGDGAFDGFDLGDIDSNNDGVVDSLVLNHLWVDTNGDGIKNTNEVRPFNYTRGADASGSGTFVDSDGDGFYDPGEPRVRDDARLARQLYARHLYCLMLLLVDENYLAPYDSNNLQVRQYLDPDMPSGVAQRIAERLTNNPPATYPLPHQTGDPRIDAREIALRKLTRRRIAQWAINVVDFRDPDAIQTPFEYDENPWDGWNIVDNVGDIVVPLDGDLSTDESLGQSRVVTGAGFSSVGAPTAGLSPLDDTRGVVWGAERPEVLLTEGLAWHDRKLEDADIAVNSNSSNPAPDEYDGGLVADEDDDLDQVRVPRGYTFLEAFNPWLNREQRPAEFYSFIDRQSGQITFQEGVRFDRLSNAPLRDPSSGAAFVDPDTGDVVRSPVWRVICVEENPLLRNATQLTATGPGGGTSPSLSTLTLSDDQPANGDPFYQKGMWEYDEFRSPFIGTTNKYAELIDEKTLDYEAATLLTQVADVLTGFRDADGVVASTGVRAQPPLVPDTSWPTFNRLLQPEHIVNGVSNTFPIDISSTIDGANGSVDRFRFFKPIRYIERAAYMVTPAPATGSVTGSSSGIGGVAQPLPNVVPARAGQQYDPSGFRVPTLRYQVPYDPVDPDEVNKWWQYNASKAPGTGFWVNANRFASFDWFNQFDDPDVADTTDRLERLDEIRLAPLLPGRRAVIGTQGAIYEDADVPGFFSTTDPDDPLGPKFIRGRYTTIVSGDGDWNATSGARTSPAAGYWRFEMIPSVNPDVHQFAVRMNGRTESLTVYDSAGAAQNVTVSPAITPGDNRDVAALPVVAVPLDNFSISEPLDRYLSRINELNVNTKATAEFERVWSISQVDAPDDPADQFREGAGKEEQQDEISEGYFPRGNTKGFDEPFDTQPELVENQTTPNYRSIHLERLANPLLPWNPPPYIPATFTSAGGSVTGATAVDYHDPNLPVNPYLPVDSMPIDLTALNSLGAEDGVGAKDNDFVNNAASSPTSNTAGPEALHRKERKMPSEETPMAFDSNERGRPWGNFRTLWTSTVDRLLWRQSRPSTTSELVRGGENVEADNSKTGEQQVYTTATSEERPALDGSSALDGGRFDPNAGQDDVTAPGYDFGFDFAQTGEKPVGLLLNFGWRMTLGFPEARVGRFYVGTDAVGDMRWVNLLPRVANAFAVDLDGDSSGLDLLASVEVVDELFGALYDDTDSNGRPDLIETITWDLNGDGVVDRHEEAQSPLRQRTTTPEFAWPNRPFASAGELLQVPAWGGSRMLTYFSAYNWLHTQAPEFLAQTQINPYNGEAAVFHDGKDYNPRDLKVRGGTALDADFANDFRDELRSDGVTAGSDGFDDGTRIRMTQHPDADEFLEEEPSNDLRFRETLGHFGHLANFFQTARFPSQTGYVERNIDTIDGNGNVTTDNERYLVPVGAAHFYRLLDYVHVPSRFVGTDTLLNADVFGAAGADPEDPRAALAAPFNRVNRYREPGRVNLNTIVGRRDRSEPLRIDNNGLGPNDGIDTNTDRPRLPDYWSEVYDGLMHRRQDASEIDYVSGQLLKAGHLGPAWRDVALSRRGYVQPGFDPTVDPGDDSFGLATNRQNQVDYSPRRMHPAFPTFFANPFRAPGEGANVPLAHMVQTGVDATLLRAHPLSPGADGAWGRRGVDDPTVKKDADNDTIANQDGLRDDAGEAGTLTMQLGGGRVADPPTQSVADRLNADVVLARFQDANGRRGSVPDTLLLDALRPHPTDLDSREIAPRQSVANFVHNSEISKRANPVPLFSGATLEPSLDTERNATTRFSPIQRLSSQSTTRSNCYAVWITVGFFEVKPANQNATLSERYGMTDGNGDGVFSYNDGNNNPLTDAQRAQRDFFFRNYPDGWTLGQELDLDTGQNRRHRGFYLVDRTRPVAFRPGEDANVSDTILLRRRIE